MYSACMYVHFSMAIWRKRYAYYDACDDRNWKKEKELTGAKKLLLTYRSVIIFRIRF